MNISGIYRRARRKKEFIRKVRLLCFIAIPLLLSLIFISSAKNTSKTISITSEDAGNMTIERNMLNPEITMEYSGGSHYTITADEAIYQGDTDYKLLKVNVDSPIGEITADALKVEDGGDMLRFTGNPVLIINPENIKK